MLHVRGVVRMQVFWRPLPTVLDYVCTTVGSTIVS